MLLTADTGTANNYLFHYHDKSVSKGFDKLVGWFISKSKNEVTDVIVEINLPEIVTGFSVDQLTKLASEMSASSFSELWDDEDDDYWNSYL